MADKELYRILSGFSDDYLPSVVYLKLIDQAFLALATTETFARNPKRAEMSLQLIELQHRLGDLFVYLGEREAS